jgi:hypothetical protein
MPRTPHPARPTSGPAEDDGPRPTVARPGQRRRRAVSEQVQQPSLAGLGIAGISRRRVLWLVGLGLAAWISIGVAGQATEAARAADRASREQATNGVLADRISGLDDELDLVVQRRWFLQAARAYALGGPGERPFALDPSAASLPPDAPGSPERRLGSEATVTSPLDSWLDVLFGPAPGG